jgi:uncharacterized protein YndB with AHSA1/START domain
MVNDTRLRATVRRTLHASAEEVFAYWTEAKKLKVWLGMDDVQVDARVGGCFRFEFRNTDFEPGLHIMWGEYRILEKSRIVSSLIYEPPSSEVRKAELTVEIQELEPNLVRLTVCDEDPCHSNRHERSFSRLEWSSVIQSLQSVMDLDRALGEGQWYRGLPMLGTPFRRTPAREMIWFDPFEVN